MGSRPLRRRSRMLRGRGSRYSHHCCHEAVVAGGFHKEDSENPVVAEPTKNQAVALANNAKQDETLSRMRRRWWGKGNAR